MVSVAQLVESRIVIPVVAGSNPVVHPNNFNSLRDIIICNFSSGGKSGGKYSAYGFLNTFYFPASSTTDGLTS